MSEKLDRCYREPTNGVYFTRNRHRHDCDDIGCKGCVTCPGRHCTSRPSCTWHLATGELTCGRCIAGVRRELKWIGDAVALMPTAAMCDGVDSAAANLAGPAADAEAWTWRKVAARQGVAWHVSLIEDDDEHHPGRVVGTWQRMIAEDYGHDPIGDLAGQLAYLDRNLHRIAHDEEQDFPLLRRELKKCRQHLEAVLHNDTKPEQGAPCPKCRPAHRTDCDKPGCRGCVIVRLTRTFGHWCADEDCERLHFADEGGDVWRCPRDSKHWWTAKGYADLLDERRVSA